MQLQILERSKSVQFASGTSGNPGGRTKDEARVAEQARSYTAEVIDTPVTLMRKGRESVFEEQLLKRFWIEDGASQRWKWSTKVVVGIC